MKSQLAIELSENAVHFASIEDGIVKSLDKFTFKDKIPQQKTLSKYDLLNVYEQSKIKTRNTINDWFVNRFTPWHNSQIR